MKLEKLDKEAKAELPAAGEKMSNYKGTLAHWVISSLGVGFTTLLLIINSNYKAQIEDCKLENAEYKKILIPQLHRLESKVQEVEQKADTVANKIESKE